MLKLEFIKEGGMIKIIERETIDRTIHQEIWLDKNHQKQLKGMIK